MNVTQMKERKSMLFADQEPRQEWRSVQIYLILIARAEQRRTITYNQLGEIMYHKPDVKGVFGKMLGSIAMWCDKNDLPRLNYLVVNGDGNPGEGIGDDDPDDAPAVREEVFKIRWYDIVPPRQEELKEWNYKKARFVLEGGS